MHWGEVRRNAFIEAVERWGDICVGAVSTNHIRWIRERERAGREIVDRIRWRGQAGRSYFLHTNGFRAVGCG